MKELYRTENEIKFYLQPTGHIAIYDNGNYYYQNGYDIKIEEIEEHICHKFQLSETERERINYLMINHNKDRYINSIYEYYAYQNQNYVKVRKDIFEDCELYVLLENDFTYYYCYEDETNYKYIVIEKKEVLNNEKC